MAGIVSSPSPSLSAVASPALSERYRVPLAVLTSLFFMWGFLTCMNDILIPHLKAVFDLGYARAMLVQFAFFAAYFVMSLPSGLLVGRWGYKAGIVIGLLAASLGCALFYPAASLRSYGMFLLALFVLASGITLLQVAANPFVAVLGSPQTAPARLTLTQAFNSLGTTLAPAFGSAFLLADAATPKTTARLTEAELETYRAAEAAAVQTPYLTLAAALVVLAVCMALFRLPRVGQDETAGTSATGKRASSIWRFKHLVLGAVAIFLYVGGEVAVGSFLVNFLAEPTIAGLSAVNAAKLVSLYWGSAMVGRFVGSFTLSRFDAKGVLTLHAIGAVSLLLLAMASSGSVAMYAVLAVGLFNSIMFPTIFTLAIQGLGGHTSQGSGILCMAIVGGAVVPVVQGLLADAIGIHYCFVVSAACYAYVAWYGYRGARVVRGTLLAS